MSKFLCMIAFQKVFVKLSMTTLDTQLGHPEKWDLKQINGSYNGWKGWEIMEEGVSHVLEGDIINKSFSPHPHPYAHAKTVTFLPMNNRCLDLRNLMGCSC